MDCSEDENDFEALQMLTQEDDEGPEISETECDRELKMYSKAKGIIFRFRIISSCLICLICTYFHQSGGKNSKIFKTEIQPMINDHRRTQQNGSIELTNLKKGKNSNTVKSHFSEVSYSKNIVTVNTLVIPRNYIVVIHINLTKFHWSLGLR